jgi:predicted glycoside hydrolase/deacetylase ChbG (UPF0249 family)
MGREGGLLIVNADDWGYDEKVTGAIADCHLAGGLTSTTAMMFMEGTGEATSRAKAHPKLGIGLHLNLIEGYSDPSTPVSVRDRQLRLLEHFRPRRRRRWLYDPRLRHDVDRIVADQFERFVELYDRPPTHLDGHHHCHLAANVLLSSSLPRGMAIRNALSDAHRPNPLTDALRLVRRKLLSPRFRSTDFFFSVETAWPGLTGRPPPAKLGLSRRASVEVMVHPAFPREYQPLQSQEWTEALRGLPAGTFDDL